jgi:hypothetical protein
MLATRQVINGFSALINRFTGQSPVTTTNTCNTSKGYWNNKTQKSSTLPLLDAPCTNSVSKCVSNLFSSVGKTLQHLIFLSLTDGQSASLSWNKAPIWGLRPDSYYCQTVAGLLMWVALSDKKIGLLFTIAAGPRQRSHFRIRVPWDSWPHFIFRFETSLSVASYDSQGYGGGIRPRLHKGFIFLDTISPCGRFWSNRIEITASKSS